MPSTFHQLYETITSSKLNRVLLAANLTAADLIFGFPLAAKALYEINLHTNAANTAVLGPIVLLSSTAVSAALSFYIYEKAIAKLSKLKRSAD